MYDPANSPASEIQIIEGTWNFFFYVLLFYSYVTDVGPSDVATIPVITIDDSSPSSSFVSPDSVGQSNKGIRTVPLFRDHLYFI